MARHGPSESAAQEVVGRVIASGEHPELAGIVDPMFEWVGVNGPRLDARLRSADGTEWHVVVLLDGDARVSAATGFRRPEPVPAVDGLLVVVNGPSGAGKSSLLQAIAEVDAARPWVVFDEPVLGTVDRPYLIWPDAAPALHHGFLAGMAALARAGNLVATAAAGHPQSRFHAAAAGVRTISVGLHCPLDVLEAREQGREGRWGGLAASSLGAHDGWEYDLELDSTTATPTELATRVLGLV